jgi:glycine cleavage system aminomethyltransferase T
MTDNLSGALGLSPLHDYWAARSTGGRWSGGIGMLTPEVLTSYAEEAAAFGASAAFADISDRTLIQISGSDTVGFLSALCGEPEGAFAPGRARRIVWCDASGFARGSGHVAMRGDTEAVLASAISDRRWFDKIAAAFDVRLAHLSSAGLRVAGPQTHALLDRIGAARGADCDLIMPGLGAVLALQVAEQAWDVWVKPDQALGLAWALENSGARPAGRLALRAWGLSAALLTPGADWTPVQWADGPVLIRTREHVTGGHYALAASAAPVKPDLVNALYWPALAVWLAPLWLPPQAGRAQTAPQGWSILGRMATD